MDVDKEKTCAAREGVTTFLYLSAGHSIFCQGRPAILFARCQGYWYCPYITRLTPTAADAGFTTPAIYSTIYLEVCLSP